MTYTAKDVEVILKAFTSGPMFDLPGIHGHERGSGITYTALETTAHSRQEAWFESVAEAANTQVVVA